jgi:malate dehydrogenase (oxaloacetate-decarboxylating)(NADP+)
MNADHLSDYPFSKLGTTPANTFIFPNLESANFLIKSSEE